LTLNVERSSSEGNVGQLCNNKQTTNASIINSSTALATPHMPCEGGGRGREGKGRGGKGLGVFSFPSLKP
jgi:hypothetical protein